MSVVIMREKEGSLAGHCALGSGSNNIDFTQVQVCEMMIL